MAIKGFKEIIDRKGYRLDAKDRKIFERELSNSLFGLDDSNWYRHTKTDVIEFILYDSSDNQLPQGDNGDLVRYIYLDDAKINEYFTVNNDPDSTKINEARQYSVNTEKLIHEAGYSNGIFKTQITLLNRRVGTEPKDFDKLWIHEISPSRTEIRVLPIKDTAGNILPDLSTRYDIFVNEGNFRDDTLPFVQNFLENLDIQKVFNNMLSIKGNIEDGTTYINLIKSEFKINDFEIFLVEVKNKYIESMNYYMRNHVYDVNSSLYGQPLQTTPSVELTVSKIQTIASDTLRTVIDFMLLKRTILTDSSLSMEEQITFDEIDKILKTTTSNSIYDSTLPSSIQIGVKGCMDPDSLNYNPLATVDDGSCKYTDIIPNNPDKVGFESNWTTTKTFYVWSTLGYIEYTDSTGASKWKGVQGDSVKLTYLTSESLKFIGDIREVPYTPVKFVPIPITDFEPTPPELTESDLRGIKYDMIINDFGITRKVLI